MATSRTKILVGLLVVTIVVSACSFGPPPSCGENIGGTADEAKFDEHFSSMSLVSQSIGQPGPEGDNGLEFSRADTLLMQVESRTDVELRACVQPRGGGGRIPFDQTQTFSQGQGTFNIGSFEPGAYVIRVIVDGTLVKNFPFGTE